jgi:hypothetical protein
MSNMGVVLGSAAIVLFPSLRVVAGTPRGLKGSVTTQQAAAKMN